MGADRFWGPEGERALSLIPRGDYEFLPDDLPRSTTIIQAHPSSAYYGPGYERGDWPELAAIIEYLRHRLNGVTVWYGDDASDVVRETTRTLLDEMWAYWATHGSRPYDNRQKSP